MQIQIIINDELKTFTTDIVPMRAKRKFVEIRAKEEKLFEEKGHITDTETLELENELLNILVDIVFKNQFTVDELIDGVTEDYYNKKLSEAVFGITGKTEGNTKGK